VGGCLQGVSIKEMYRPEGELKIAARLVPSPLCAPARITGLNFAQPVKPQKRWPVDSYPLHHPLRAEAKAREEMRQTAKETFRRATMVDMLDTQMVRGR